MFLNSIWGANGPKWRFIVWVVALASAPFPALAQQPNTPGATLGIDGDLGPSGPLDGSGALGNPFTLEIRGSAGALRPFVLAFGRVRPVGATTAFGRLDLDGQGCPLTILLNGFDPSGPLAGFGVLGPAGNPAWVVTLPALPVADMPGGIQALVADPASAGGLTLSAAVDFFPAGAVITGALPATGSAGGGDLVRIAGRFDCDVPSVTFGGVSATLLLASRSEIQVLAPPSAVLGAVVLTVTQAKGAASVPFTYAAGNPITVLSETFDTPARKDGSYAPEMRGALWADPAAPGQLTGNPIGGSPLATFQGTGTLGTRVQVTVTPSPLAAPPQGLFSPFDDGFGFNLGLNPNGGSHIMHLYERADLGFIRDSLELVEWGPTLNTVLASSYPQFTAWCGETTRTGPMAGGQAQGLGFVYRNNYDVPAIQPVDPANASFFVAGAGGVRVVDATTYTTPAIFTDYMPFPHFDRTFDFRGSGAGAANLILEMDVAPGTQVANFNRFRATNFTPVRRLIGPSLTGVPANPVAAAGGFDIYDQRFTFVGSRASAQSLFIDSGLTAPIFLDLAFSPSPLQQPAGTEALIEVQGADFLLAPNVALSGQTPWLVYFSGDPSTGTFDSSALLGAPGAPQLSGHRFHRFRVTLRANHRTNAIQSYDQVDASVTF